MQDYIERLKGKPAIFCLSGSPFQAMCMIEAINTFELKDYRVLLCLSHSELPRKRQLTELLDKHGITYEEESIDFKISKSERLKALIPQPKGPKLVFIGDCNNELLIFKAFRYVADGGTLIYLDDGIATIQFFNGLCQLQAKLRKYYTLICRLRNICFDKYFFTIYHDLKDGKHLSIANSFSYLSRKRKGIGEKKNIILLGTCTDDFCRMERISVDSFLREQRRLMEDIKTRYPEDDIIFVPHGRDVYKQTEADCAETGIIFQPTSISVEMFLLDSDFTPKAVYGYTSSALYNLRLLLPSSDMVNITFKGNSPENDRIEITSRYYSQHGIIREIRELSEV